MKGTRLLSVLIVSTVVFTVGAPFAQAHGPGHNPTRHEFIMQQGVPGGYRGQLNPLKPTAENLAAGSQLYADNCASCHGIAGTGDGELAKDLDPVPPDLTGMYARPMPGMDATVPGAHMMHGRMHHHPGLTHAEAMGGLNLDAYSFWTVSEGGEPLGGTMPAFKDVLSAGERWQILLYIANGFRSQPSS